MRGAHGRVGQPITSRGGGAAACCRQSLGAGGGVEATIGRRSATLLGNALPSREPDKLSAFLTPFRLKSDREEAEPLDGIGEPWADAARGRRPTTLAFPGAFP
jgi:hypothetical protein